MSPQEPTLVLLPGMDGTGGLFADFVRSLPPSFETFIVRYPRDLALSYSQLADLTMSAVPTSTPFVIIAESFSVPVAIAWASTHPCNLKSLILCAGFATSPARGWRRTMCRLLSPALFQLSPPGFAIERFLAGPAPPRHLVALVKRALSSVQPKVLSSRLRSVLACDVRSELRKVNVPILFLQPREDRLVGPGSLDEMMFYQPAAAVQMVDGPHLVLQRRPEQTAALVSEFVRQYG